ncbi:MAG TPA: aromatic amino acid lyase, partial [Pyrinomonadaceae bacterium]|nr:aromatic amino acid lyase [Pyrinomonadaceae bacterium]
IPEKGSVGASGDLAPLAHLALCCMGEGEAVHEGRRVPGAEALDRAGIEPLTLEAKEGLALLNGTQALTAVGALALERAIGAVRAADVSGAMALEALKGTPAAFDERIHAARPHRGQRQVAARLRELLRDSEIRASHAENDPRVQDAYSLRCMPQVHGAALDALEHARSVIETETGSATDNPLVFAAEGDVVSGGNFHGAPCALALDYAAVALTHLGNIVERRIDRLVNPDKNEGLPPFLTARAGVESGYMVAQIVAVALLNECKVLAHPASTDNLPTDGGKEDHVSMGMTAATKLRRVVENIETVVAIELLAAAEGLEHRAPLRPGVGVRRAYDTVRSHAPRLTRDRALSADFDEITRALRRGEFDL